MKKVLLLLSALFFLRDAADGLRAAPAAGSRYPAFRYVNGPKAEWRGDSLEVRFSGEVAGRLEGSESLHLIPIYISDGDTVRFPELGYFTPSGAKYHRRREALSDSKTVGKVRILYRGGHGDFDYRNPLPESCSCSISCGPAAKSTCWLRKQSPFRSVPSRCPIRSIRPLRACCHFRWPP